MNELLHVRGTALVDQMISTSKDIERSIFSSSAQVLSSESIGCLGPAAIGSKKGLGGNQRDDGK
jgi:hypothetical protein